MVFQRIEQGEEIVLSYCPDHNDGEIRLSYESALPERMRRQEVVFDDPVELTGEKDEGLSAKEQKRRNRGSLIAIILCATLALCCIGAGVMGIVGSFNDFFAGVEGPADSGNSSEDADDGSGEDGDDAQEPEWDYGNEQHEKPKSEPKIGAYRPAEGTPGLELVNVRSGRKQLTSDEVYRKVAPSTVTILGIHGETYSVGTGVIFASDGYIVTNYHVIAGCIDCEVWVTNEYGVDTVYKALLVGGDDEKDLAVLKIDAQGLPAAEFGESGELVVGDKVYAIGNPLGTELRSTFTDGIVSAVDRNVDVDGVNMTLIQTNTALNSGNSGGPLINAYGQVIGINTIKMMSGYDTIEGLGFAIPSNLVRRWVNDIITLGEVRPTPMLGLSVNRIPVVLQDGTVGLEVLDVTQGMGAYRAGIQIGDVIVAFNGVNINRVDDIYAQRVLLAVGDSVVVRVYRNGEYLDITMIMMAAN